VEIIVLAAATVCVTTLTEKSHRALQQFGWERKTEKELDYGQHTSGEVQNKWHGRCSVRSFVAGARSRDVELSSPKRERLGDPGFLSSAD
jgi:hypothetical protein